MDFDEIEQLDIDLVKAERKFSQAKQFQQALRKSRKQGKQRYDGWYRSADWKNWRSQQLERQKWHCACCEKVMKLSQPIFLANGDFKLQANYPTVDHILPKSFFPELALDKQNLIMLCWACNREKGNNVASASRLRHQQLKQSFEGWQQ